MKVREAVSVVAKAAQTVYLAWDSLTTELASDDLVMLEAFGDYLVDRIVAYNCDEKKGGLANTYEIHLVTRPVKEGDV